MKDEVENLFGEDAVNFVKKMRKDGRCWNAYGIGNFTMAYLNYEGFQIAATFYNLKVIEQNIKTQKGGAVNG